MRSISTRRRMVPGILAVVTAAVVIAACGDETPLASPGSPSAGIPVATATPTPLPIGSSLLPPPVKTKHVQPSYPADARQQRIQGTVIVEAVIGTNGRIQETTVIQSVHPLLDNAAVEAIRQWEFEPFLLNGVPVPVIYTITVNFVLQ
jgi:periplasmic protein TonB